jgi:hypothetical protein
MLTQKAQLDYYRKILNKGLCSSLFKERNDDYKDLMFLFTKHPEYPYKTRDVIDINITQNTLNTRALQFNLIRKNGDIEDISYRYCIVKPKDNHRFIGAMRSCIKPQITSFRKTNLSICQFCGETENIHIDHIYTFKNLVNDFLLINPDKPTLFNQNTDNQHIFRKEDANFANKWFQYHKLNATLRPLCAKCNLSRKK